MDELRSVVQESWSKAVLAASSVEEQAQQLVARLQKLVGESAFAPEHARRIAGEIAERLGAHRKELQSQVEETVRRALDRLRLPNQADLRSVHDRLDALESKLARLEQKEKSGA